MCCIFNTVVVVACVIFIPGFSPCRGYWVWVFCCLFVVYIYVRLIISNYLLFCTGRYLLFNVWYIACCPNEKKLWNLQNWKTSAVSTTDGWLKLNFASCVIRQTRSLGVLVLCSNWNTVFVNYLVHIYDMVVDTQFHKFYGRPFARVLFIPHERYRSVTPLGVTRVNRTILQGRCCP